MANTKEGTAVTLTADELTKMISTAVATAVEEAKKPYIDPKVEAQKQADREAHRASIKRAREMQKRAWDSCNHLKEDGSSAFALARHCDQSVSGVCQICSRPLMPSDPDYDALLKRPVKQTNFMAVAWNSLNPIR